MNEDCWEARMSARAKARAEVRQVQREATLAEVRRCLSDSSAWLHGWPLLEGGMSVLMGTTVRCAGCGRCHGVTSVVLPEGWEPPGPEPDWPFPRGGCPVCRFAALDG
jgi:hypothetical protein